MHNLGRALELRAARRVIAQAGAAEAFLVLLVALLARLLVLADHVEIGACDLGQLALGHRLGQVGVEVIGACVAFAVVQTYDRAAVLGVDDAIVLVVGQLDQLASKDVLVFVHGLVLYAA